MTTKKELKQKNEQLWQTINQLRNNITELEDEIKTLEEKNKAQGSTINVLKRIIQSLHGKVWDATW